MSYQIIVKRFALEFRLSRTEERLLILAVEGDDNATIAHKLECARKTVDSLWSRIRVKSERPSQRAVLAALIRAGGRIICENGDTTKSEVVVDSPTDRLLSFC
jgi:DNA-binding CsgD family transcriptional regulator